MAVNNCRDCPADTVWAVTEKSGKPMLVDAEPVETGTILLRHLEHGQPPVAHVTTAEERVLLGQQAHERGETLRLFVSHFATCPNAANRRRR